MRKTIIGLGLAFFLTASGAALAAPNTLTPAEKKAGWRLLFDGKSTKGWRTINGPSFPAESWTVDAKAGVLRVTPRPENAGKMGSDLITVEKVESFELRFDFKLAPGGNSGVKYLVDEAKTPTGHSGLGFEFQILDDDKHPDAKAGKNGNRTVGSLYDLIAAPADKVVRPPGQWNEGRVIVDGNHVEHWLNGKKTVELERGSAEMKALVAGSKYKDKDGFGLATSGHILLQDHGDVVELRNVKLRPITGKPPTAAAVK